MIVKFTILGDPKAKQRPRLGKWRTYTPKETVEYENWVKECYLLSHSQYLKGDLEAKIVAYFSIPKSTSSKKRNQMGKGSIRPTKRPDLDNIAKIIQDALNGIAYDDDSQFVDLHISKYYSATPRVEVEIKELEVEELR